MSVPYEKRQKKWIEKHNVKVGDFVTVMQKYDSKTCGIWTDLYCWVPEMGEFVGKVCKVVRICEDAIELITEGCSVSYRFPYSILRKEKEMKNSYEERQAEWIKKHDVKVGDHVRLVRAASTREDGWPNMWPNTATRWVGKMLEVKGFNEGNIRCLNLEEKDWFDFPYFVLEKIVEHKDKEWTVSYGLKVKTGDPVLMRDSEASTWRYSVFSHNHDSEGVPYPYYSAGVIAAFCIPYVGNEHMVGTKDDYKASEEQQKPKFIFGAKVKAMLSSGEEMEGVLIGFDTEDDDSPFEVAVRDKDEELGRVRYWAESVTYID